MEILNKFRKAGRIRNAIGLIIIGLLFVVISIFMMRAPKVEYVPATATIADIQSEYDSAQETDVYTVFVNYTIDGVDYKNIEFGSYSSSMSVGDTVDIEYDPADPSHIQAPGSGFIVYIALAAGAIAFVAGIILTVKSIKQRSSDMNEYNRVDMSKASEDEIDAIRNSDEPTNSYVFHFDKNIKQGYQLEDAEHRMIYEAKMTKLSVAKPFVFEFINHISHSVKTMEIGHTVSKSIGMGEGHFKYSVPISSAFTVDGVSNWDYLAEKGFGFDFRMNGIKPCFDVLHYGVKVAYIETAGSEVINENSKNPLSKLPINGLFRVECRNSDLDMVFMTCFSIARAIFYENM